MTTSKTQGQVDNWQNGYNFALILMFLLGISTVAIAELGFQSHNGFWYTLFLNTGISLGPAAAIAYVFRIFLFKEVKYELSTPLVEEIKERIENQIGNSIMQIKAYFNAFKRSGMRELMVCSV